MNGSAATTMGRAGWALYQFASSPYFVIINIFVFAAYFQRHVVGEAVHGQVVWGYTQAAAGALIALASPVLGALADAYGQRKPGVVIFSAAALPAMLAIWFVTPGAMWLGVAAILMAAVTMEIASVYHNALLTSVAGERNVGTISGIAYSLDYVGSVTLFVIWLAIPGFGLLAYLDGPFAHERLSGPLSAVWLVVFSIPLLLFTADTKPTGLSVSAAVVQGLANLRQTVVRAGHYRNLVTFLLVRAVYADGMSAVFTFLAGYLSGIFNWPTQKIGIYALVVLSVPILTSFLAGRIDDLVGSKRTIAFGLAVFTIAVLGSVSTTPDEFLFVFPVTETMRSTQLPLLGPMFSAIGFTEFPEQVSLAFSILGGAFVGPVLSSSRTMVARIAPAAMISEAYGLYTLTGKATAFAAPALVAVVTQATQSQRAGFAVILVFLVLGLAGLLLVREERVEPAAR